MAREPEQIAQQRQALGAKLGAYRQAAKLTQARLAQAMAYDRSTLAHLERGRSRADEDFWQRADDACCANGALIATFHELEAARVEQEQQARQAELEAVRAKAAMPPMFSENDEYEALELARRVAASDVGNETLARLESIVDELAIAYSKTPPALLLERIRQHLHYVMRLLDARKTLAEHRRLLVIGGWLSLLAATVHIDLKQQPAATARLKTAVSLARHAGHEEIHAWCYETEAWRVLNEGKYPQALELSRAAQAIAPSGSSAAIQSTAQAGRAWARLKQSRETYAALMNVDRLMSAMTPPDQPQHHYRYDPDKSVIYVATTLAWLGDPAAETYAREVIARLGATSDAGRWPRRVALANIDLSLTLLVTNRLDEACDATMRAISSGTVVPANHWRAAEVVKAVEARKLPEAVELREAYEGMRRG